MFDVKPVSDMILNRKRNFLTKFVNNCNNVVCDAISILAKCELDCLQESCAIAKITARCALYSIS